MLFTEEEFIELGKKYGELMYLAYTVDRYKREMKCSGCKQRYEEGGLKSLLEGAQNQLKEKGDQFVEVISPRIRKSLGNSEAFYVGMREFLYRRPST